MLTKLEKVLRERKLSPQKLTELIDENNSIQVSLLKITKICNSEKINRGDMKYINLISKTIKVPIEELVEMSKLERILIQKGISQVNLVRLIKEKSGFEIGKDRISKICTGRLKNYTVETAKMISEALDVPMDEFVELQNIKKENKA